jgi:hypothetical protein
VDEAIWYPEIALGLKLPPMPWLDSLTHGDDGPVNVPGLALLTLPPAMTNQTSDACVVVLVGPSVHDETNPLDDTVADWSSSGPVVGIPDTSYTHARIIWVPVMTPEVEITTEVWPPAQLGSDQADAIAWEVVVPTVASDAQWSAEPPSVIPDTEPLSLVPTVSTIATRALPVVVAAPMVTVILVVELTAFCPAWTTTAIRSPARLRGTAICSARHGI